MKRNLIELGADYAVDFLRPYYGGTAKGYPSQRVIARRRCTIVDKRGNGRIVVQYLDPVCVNAAEFGDAVAEAMVNGKLRWEDQWVLVEVGDHQVIARWGEQPPVQVYNGRPHVPSAEPSLIEGAA